MNNSVRNLISDDYTSPQLHVELYFMLSGTGVMIMESYQTVAIEDPDSLMLLDCSVIGLEFIQNEPGLVLDSLWKRNCYKVLI
ncbi:hypothetical protein VNO78_12341 [Psophocarpus tetragonolobus]|uniref:Uncharacterized protein n=1 Tax=Psophocarpus tetragonolobus TaxID=3891 RepID=A0AAN9SMU1_PSOTE